MPPDTVTASIGPTSITTPALVERPAKQCPPLRATAGIPKASVAATSSGVRQRTTAAGRTSWKRAIAGRRAAS